MSEIVVVSASEANRGFSKILRMVRDGAEVRVTSHGRTVARIVPPDDGEAERERRRAGMEKLIKRLESQPMIVVGPWTREELYDRD